MKMPKPISDLIESLERLPGIGPKTSQRLTFHLLHFPQEDLEKFARSLVGLKTGIKLCLECKNVTENEICSVCGDTSRDKNIIAVVAGALDSFALEKTGFKGVYHVLHGVIDPLNNVGPDELFIKNLVSRLENKLKDGAGEIEVILATNTSMEGESTAMYISRMIRGSSCSDKVRITRIARGLPVGGDIEYADDITLSRALEGRLDF
jgi:recombination protein RecR